MKRERLLQLVTSGALLLATASAEAQDRGFNPDLNGPWISAELGTGETGVSPSALGVRPGTNRVYLSASMPANRSLVNLGSRIFEVTAGRVVDLGYFPSSIYDSIRVTDDGVYVPGRGFDGVRAGRIWRAPFDGGPIAAVPGTAAVSEVFDLERFNDRWYMATNNAGVLVQNPNGAFALPVGTTSTVVEGIWQFEQVGDSEVWFDGVRALPDGRVVAASQLSHEILMFEDGQWRRLPDVAGSVRDENGVLISADRRPKKLAIGPNGELYVGNEGRANTPEGANRASVWQLMGDRWVPISEGVPLASEINLMLPLADGSLWVWTRRTGIWLRRSNGEWLECNQELPRQDNGDFATASLSVIGDAVYTSVGPVLYRRSVDGDGAWSRVVSTPMGEGVSAASGDGEGRIYIGVQAGSNGRVYRLDGENLEPVGELLPTRVVDLHFDRAGQLFARTGGSAGIYTWDGARWRAITAALFGNPSSVVDWFFADDGSLYIGTRQSVWRGRPSDEPQRVTDSPVRVRPGLFLFSMEGSLYLVNAAGFWALVQNPTSDDGFAWVTGARGLPEIEPARARLIGDELFILSTQPNTPPANQFPPAIYRGTRAPDGLFDFELYGTNPGQAQIDGNGDLIFAGTVRSNSIVRGPGDAVYVATADALMVSDDEGESWDLVNGVAHVLDLVKVGEDVLYAAVQGQIVDGDTTTLTTSLWVTDISGDPIERPDAEPPFDPDVGVALDAGGDGGGDDGGAGGAGGAGGEGGEGGGAGSGGAPDGGAGGPDGGDPTGADGGDDGCGCRVDRADDAPLPVWSLGMVLFAAVFRPRRRR